EEFAGATRDEREAEVAWQAGLDRVPALCGVGGAEDSPVELHVEGVRSARVERDAVHAPVDADTVPTRRDRRDAPRPQLPARAAVVGPEHADRRDGHPHAVRVVWVLDDGVEA